MKTNKTPNSTVFPNILVHSLGLTFSEAVASLVPWALNASEAKGLSWAGIMATALCNEQPTRLCKNQNKIILISLSGIIFSSMNIQNEVIMNVYWIDNSAFKFLWNPYVIFFNHDPNNTYTHT